MPPKKPRRQNPTPKKGPKWIPAFLAALRETGNIGRSCECAKIHRSTVYDRRTHDSEFARQWGTAEEDATDRLLEEARRRGHDGVQRLKFHQGELIRIQAFGPDGKPLVGKDGAPVLVPYVEHDYSDALLMFLIKARRPEYRDTHRHEHSGPAGRPIPVSVNLSNLSDEQLDQLDRLLETAEGDADPGSGASGEGPT